VQAVKALRDRELNSISIAPSSTAEDMRVIDFWEHHYLLYCEKEWVPL